MAIPPLRSHDGYTDKYSFAWAMMGMAENMTTTKSKILACIGINTSKELDYFDNYKNRYSEDPNAKPAGNGDDLYMTDIEYQVFSKYYGNDTDLTNAYDNLINAEDDSKRREALKTFRETLYSGKRGNEIYDAAKANGGAGNENWSDISGEFNYYVNLWEAIHEAGGCEAINQSCQSGETGNDWFNNMVNAGLVGIKYLDSTKGNKEWSDTSIATSTNHNYLKEEQDETDLKKAEAAYEHGLDLINQKDTKFDTELSKLETERSAITTEMESISKVRDENVERTFGIFS